MRDELRLGISAELNVASSQTHESSIRCLTSVATGRSKLDVPLNEPIVPHLKKLLGPAKTTQAVFETLDRQYREQNKSAIWFLPLSQPIAPHLDELLGPLK